MEFQFNPDLDPDQLGKAFRREGRLQIKDIWAPGVAEAIHDRLANGTEWNLVYNKGDNVIQVKAEELRRMLERRKRDLTEKISKQALTDFAFCYLSYPVSDTYLEAPDPDNLLHRYLEFINTPETLDFFRRLSGIPEIIRGDAHATCYQGGHFLTVHDDAPNYEPRRMAYVFGFSEDWQPDWGG